MNIKDLLFFNKEGYPMNLGYDEEQDLISGKIYFDKNSTETFKTQGIYLFEKVEGSNNTFQAYLDKYQIFNTNGFKTFPIYGSTELEITDIKLTNIDSTYNTKWIYADGVENHFYQGMYCYFTGLDSFHNNDFNTTFGNRQIRKILAVEKNRILVWTETSNNIALPTFNVVDAKIIPANCIEIQQSLSEPLWNETSLNTKLYSGKKISYVANSENAGIYNIDAVANTYNRNFHILSPTLYSPSIGDSLQIKIQLNTSNIKISDGVTDFGGSGATFITLPYIPSFLKNGDTIQAQEKTISLSLGNDILFTILSINRSTNTIEVNSPVTNQVVDCEFYLGTNIFNIEQDILYDNNNLLSLPLTYWSIVNKYKDELLNISGGYRLEYNTITDELHIISDYTNNYATVTVNYINNNIVNNLTIIDSQYTVYLLNTKENLIEEDSFNGDATIYNRTIKFTNIDSIGLNIKINGVDYNTPFDTDVNNTIINWIATHNTTLLTLGVVITQISTDTINITTDYPNVSIITELLFGDSTIYEVKYKDIQFTNIKSQLLITIDSKNYIVPFDTDDDTTVTNWVNTYKPILKTLNILVSNTFNILHVNTLDTEKQLSITYNIGYIPKSGDLSVYETLFATNNGGSIITGNEIKINTGTYNLLDYYSVGQKISILGASKLLQNKSYNIIGLSKDSISLSYQGAFWQKGLPVFNLTINSDYFIRFPKYGYMYTNNPTKFEFSWKDTQIPDFFFYDFSGNQLNPINDNFKYTGIKPLCGTNGEIELKLNRTPNTDLRYTNDPTKQQTIFDKIVYNLPLIDTSHSINVEPEPMQIFIGYNSTIEGWNKSRLYLDLIENISFNLTSTLNDDIWNFKDNYVEVLSPTVGFDFTKLSFKKNQIVEFISTDINSDNKQLAILKNAGIKYKIKDVEMHKITFTKNVIEETSVVSVPSPVLPYYDISGNPIFVNRFLNVQINVLKRTIAYFDIYGESEEEDIRHKINLNNKNINILKLQDFFIFKNVDIKEEGIDWIFLNRKRKELIEIYPEIFNNLSSYKSVIQAINFFGYNDLSFTEYFQNINPESNKYGQLMNMELLNIFDKSVDGWQFSNLAFENLRNEGFRKTNLFALNYKITDTDGNFINAYSLDEVRIKLLGLKRWLTENIIPLGTKIADINGKYQMQQDYTIKHSSYMSKNFRVEEYAAPIDFNVSGYSQPITGQPNTYDISVEFFSHEPIDWFEYKIRTFYIEKWKPIQYTMDSVVLYNDVIYKNTYDAINTDIPGISNNWIKTSIESLETVQIFRDYKWQEDNTSFTINSLVDPYFIIEVYWHSGYSTTHKTVKSFTVI